MTPERVLAAGAVVLAYLLLCAGTAWRWRRQRRRAAAGEAFGHGNPGRPWLVVHASQTGQAEALALRTARLLGTAGVSAQLLALAELKADELAAAPQALFIVSTYGEGDPPDTAAGFVRRVMAVADAPELAALRFGLLALGDRSYPQFCGFGRALHQWLLARGAQPLAPSIEVSQSDPQAIDLWFRQVGHLAGIADLPDLAARDARDTDTPFEPWRLQTRRLLNPGSVGAPCFHIELRPPETRPAPPAEADWEAGDLVQVQPPGCGEPPREYSVASVPADGSVHLLVRLHRRSDGSDGLASGWLTQRLQPGDEVPLRLRRHGAFRIGANEGRPLVLIGNGSGLAGLRAHWRQRARARGLAAAAGQPLPPACWLLYGERQQAHDRHHGAEIDAMATDGVLARVDFAWSRDGAAPRHVQHLLHEAGRELQRWVRRQDAAIYVCGSLHGMAGAVDQALRELLGSDALDALADEGRYRRDVY